MLVRCKFVAFNLLGIFIVKKECLTDSSDRIMFQFENQCVNMWPRNNDFGFP